MGLHRQIFEQAREFFGRVAQAVKPHEPRQLLVRRPPQNDVYELECWALSSCFGSRGFWALRLRRVGSIERVTRQKCQADAQSRTRKQLPHSPHLNAQRWCA